EMVRAILEGRKTVTRRLVKPQPLSVVNTLYRKDGTNIWRTHGADCWYEFRAPCVPGDILWVRETWCESLGRAGKYFYRAYAGQRDEMKEYAHSFNRWRPSIHMPREAARIFLRVTDVSVERLQTMSHEDAEQEGCWCAMPIDKFAKVWEGTIKPADQDTCGWDANPWVWVISFVRINKAEAIGRCAE
ncbi:hypothetical protein, partial [Pseudoflavonifractor phocaeensis]|uniref:hypothetical protein n=1 Tax=Pseudoflavonifractor phocaeensis TaxID=1870988 RepID=UPI00195A2D46